MIRHALSLVIGLTSLTPASWGQGTGVYNTVDNYPSNESSYQGAPRLNKSKQMGQISSSPVATDPLRDGFL